MIIYIVFTMIQVVWEFLASISEMKQFLSKH